MLRPYYSYRGLSMRALRLGRSSCILEGLTWHDMSAPFVTTFGRPDLVYLSSDNRENRRVLYEVDGFSRRTLLSRHGWADSTDVSRLPAIARSVAGIIQ